MPWGLGPFDLFCVPDDATSKEKLKSSVEIVEKC